MAFDLSGTIRSVYTTLVASNFRRHALLVVALVGMMFLIAFFTGRFAHVQAAIWLCQYDMDIRPDCAERLELTAAAVNQNGNTNVNVHSGRPTPLDTGNTNANTAASDEAKLLSTETANATPSPTPPPVATPTPLTAEQKDRLAAQKAQVQNLAKHHGKVMAFFYEAYYTALSVVLVMGVIVAVSLFAIAQDGWTNANPYVKTVFIVATAGVAFFGLWPPVFEQEKNISDNKALFLEYKTLKNEIESFPVTRSNVKNEVKDPNTFISYVDSEMARLGNIAIGFDYTKINYKGAFDVNPNPTPPPPSTTPPNKNNRKPG